VHSGTELILSAAEGIVMSTPSLDAEVLRLLEEQVAFHREQLEKASRLLERARAAVAVREPLTAALAHTPLQDEDLTSVSRMVARLVEAWPLGSPFGATLVAEEIGRRFGREATPAEVSVKLRRLSHQGVIRTVREGQSHIESLFEKPHG
jgi:hypothetical protein